MIIELVGATGVGKTTLAAVCSDLDDSFVTADDVLLDHLVVRRISKPTLKNFVLDLVAIPFFLLALRRHGRFAAYAIWRLIRFGPTIVTKLNYVRSVVRRVGVYELLSRRRIDKIVLVDEGTVLIAYLMFVYSKAAHTPDDLARFAELVPMPDGVVFATAPISVLHDRASSRLDIRRELIGLGTSRAIEVLENADRLFRDLMGLAAFREHTLKVRTDGSDVDEMTSNAANIRSFALNLRASAGSSDPRTLRNRDGVDQ